MSSTHAHAQLQPHHLSNLMTILRDANVRYHRLADTVRSSLNPTHHARKRAAKLGLSVSIARAVACPAKQVSHIPLPVLDLDLVPSTTRRAAATVAVVASNTGSVQLTPKRPARPVNADADSVHLVVTPQYHLSNSPLRLILPSLTSRLRRKHEQRERERERDGQATVPGSTTGVYRGRQGWQPPANSVNADEIMFDIQLSETQSYPDVPDDCTSCSSSDSEDSSSSSEGPTTPVRFFL